jgi:uncharacterized protein (DUF488 family)
MSPSPLSSPVSLWTVGHSTRKSEEFVTLLQAHAIACLVDVRRHPGSRRYPQFNVSPLADALRQAGMRYVSMPALGGRRQAHPNSLNSGWRNASFRGYADYMAGDEFREALDQLIVESRAQRTAIMCAEAVPWRCHRSLIADALVVKGCEVRHIMSATRSDLHRLTPFARVEGGRLIYPPASDTPSLF